MLQHLNNRLGKGVAALAVMLIALLVVQTPVAMADRMLHASGQTHAVNAFAGPLAVDLVDHDHDHDPRIVQDHPDDDAKAAPAVDDDRQPSPSQGSHHHHDGPSLLGLATAVAVASPWLAPIEPWTGRNVSLASAGLSPQKRPPRTVLEPVA